MGTECHRVGLIGCGWMAPFHAAALQSLSDRARVVWAADPVRERAEATALPIGARSLTDYHEGLGEVDCAFVVVPHNLHHPITLDCFCAGCHVLLEKPIATSVEQADEMIEAAERAGKTFMVGYQHRYKNCVQQCMKILDSGRYGKPFLLEGVMDSSMKGYALGWIAIKETLGGGVFFSSSPHLLDVMLFVGGEVQSLRMVGTRGGVSMEGEDTAACVMKFRNGMIGLLRDTWASPRCRTWYSLHAACEKAHVTLTTTPLGDLARDAHRCAWVTRIVADGEAEEVLLESGEGLDVVPEIQHFFDCVDSGNRPQTDGRMARKLIALILEAYRDAETDGAN